MWYRPSGLNDAPGHLRTIEFWERAEGSPAPLGATWVESEQGWNFACYSRHATGVVLLLYGEEDPATPAHQVRLEPLQNKTGRIWHCFVPVSAAPAARYYAYRVEGPWDPGRGYRFDASKILLDPFAEEVHFEEGDLYVMINAYWEPLRFHVQEGEAREWHRVVDTSRPSPEDIAEP